jgi:Glycosyltransferase like family 2
VRLSSSPEVVANGSKCPSIQGIVVAVPARNEASWIGRTLSSIQCSVRQLSASVATTVSIACDSCIDDTAAEIRRADHNDSTAMIVEGTWQSVGGARRAAVQRGLDALLATGLSLERIWIASTDADTTVQPDWLTRQLLYAEVGVHAVAGIVNLRRDADLTRVTEEIFCEMYRVPLHGHSHVHGANLGVRADAYTAAGGYPVLLASEDRELWNSLLTAGYRCHASSDLRVETSARLHGRVEEGFAFALRKRQTKSGRAKLELTTT